MNEDGQCFPSGSCPDGYHRANDDETGACICEEDLKQCDDGSWAHPGDFCREEEPPIECPEGTIPDPESEGRCIEPPADFKACPDMVDNPDCKLDEEPTTCEEGFVLENGKCAALDSNCGGVECTASDKENSTTSDPVEGTSEPEPEEPKRNDEEDNKTKLTNLRKRNQNSQTRDRIRHKMSDEQKEFRWVYVVRWHHSGHIWKIFDDIDKAKEWVKLHSAHNIYWMAWNVE